MIQKNTTPIFFLLGSFTILLLILSKKYIKIIEPFETITIFLGTISIFYYIYNREKDKHSILSESINFFRNEILDFQQQLFKENPKLIQENGQIKNPTTISLTDYLNQNSKITIEIQNQNLENYEFLINLTSLLNKLEEFSVKIIYAGLTSHESLVCLHGAFTDIVEKNILIILMHREVSTNIKTYNSTLKLYDEWHNLTCPKNKEIKLKDQVMFKKKILEKIK